MADWRVPLSDVPIEEAEIEAVADTYRSGWLTMGPRTEELERRFAEYVGGGHAVAVSSGTAALHLICLAAGLGEGDEVVVPSLTFVATANAARYVGATPVFADISSLEAPWISAETVAGVISPRTKAIVNMTYGGHPGDSEGLARLAEKCRLTLLEDAAHGLGGRLGEKHLGTFGAAGAYSFFSNKNLAVGEGGMIATDDAAIAERVKLLRSHGMTSGTWDRHRGGAQSYDVTALGFNYRIDEPRARLATELLRRLDDLNELRAEHAATYRERLVEVAGVTPTLEAPEGARSAHHVFTVVLDQELDRDGVRARLADRGIQTSVHYPPVHGFSAYGDEAPSLPLTEAYAERSLTLPLFPTMSADQVDAVVTELAGALAAGA